MSSRERDYHFLRAELAELDKLLFMTPESAVIDRMSLKYRRSQVQAELDANPPPPRWPASAHLTFNVKPVVNGESIEAGFAGNAMEAFAKTVTSLAASRLGPLGERGAIPHQEDYRLLVTGTSHRSFGFDVEEAQEWQTGFLADESPVEFAIGQVKGILESLVGGEEEIAEAIAYTDGWALEDLRDFLKVLADSEAVCALSFKNAVFRFRDVGQVRRGIASLGTENVREGKGELTGHFQGFLPHSRQAEFMVDASGDVLSCRVDRGVDNAKGITEILNHSVTVSVRYRQVGNSRRRYTILSYAPASVA